MPLSIMISRIALYLVLTLSLLSLRIADAAGADPQVYKCPQPNGTVLYTDRLCKGATALDIRLGPADPVAPARLAHAQAALDAAVAQRKAEEQRAAARSEEFNRLRLEAEAEQEATAPVADYPFGVYGLGHRPSKGHPRHRGSPSEQHGNAGHDEGRVPATVRLR